MFADLQNKYIDLYFFFVVFQLNFYFAQYGLLQSKLCTMIDVQTNSITAEFLVPSEYKAVQYIQSSGSQWIDTLIKATNNTKVEIKTSNTYTSASQLAIMGSRTFPKTNAFMISFYGNGWICWDGAESQVSNILNKTSILLIDKNLSYIYNENTSTYDLMHTFTNATFTTPSNMILFGERQGSTVTNLSTIKFYYCKIWENNNLIREFIPCYRKSDNVIGLWDRMNEVFYTNAGSGTFTKGPDIN